MKIEEKRSGETAREYAYRTIRDNIISLDLEPGSPFNDMEMSQHIGISRTPVREAVIQLSEESRIIEIFPQRGMRIALIDVELVEEARFLRLVLEKAAAELVCDMAGEEDLAWLEENIMLQEFYMERGSSGKLLDLDNEMHRKLFTICKKELTYKIIEDHKKLLQALKARDKHLAVDTMDKHLNRWMMNEQMFRAQYPQYFK